jgi:hypothetical protein
MMGMNFGFHTSEEFLYNLSNRHVTNEDLILRKGLGSCMMDMITFINFPKVLQISYFLCQLFMFTKRILAVTDNIMFLLVCAGRHT